MIVYFLRHANAGERKPDPHRDERRGLDAEGLRQCAELGRVLALLQVQVDAILSSPLKRAAQTAALTGNEIGHEGRLVLESGLAPEASYDEFRTMLERYAHLEAVMVVGHRPSLIEFLGRMLGDATHPASIELKKGAVAKVDLRNRGARLQWCLTPRVIRTFAGIGMLSAKLADKKTAAVLSGKASGKGKAAAAGKLAKAVKRPKPSKAARKNVRQTLKHLKPQA